ncbi:MAG: cytochrome P450 [Burkholderiaceae bacterium]
MDSSLSSPGQPEPQLPAARTLASVPGPRGLPLLGHLLQIRPQRFHLQLEQWARQYGPLYRLQLKRQPLLVVGDHAVVAALLRDRPEGFRRTRRLELIWREMGLPAGLFGAEGEVWARQRRMVMAGFDPTHVRHYFPAMQQVAERLARRWRRAAMAGTAIDVQADLMRYTVDTIAGLAFGAEVNTLESDADVIQRHLDKLFPMLLQRMLAPLPTWRWWPGAADRALQASIVEIKAAVAGFVDSARTRLQAQAARRERPANLLEAMIVAADQPGSGIDDEQVAGNVLTMLLAGEDTTANTLAWLIHLLWRHPRALERATAEVRSLVGLATPITQELLGQLDYLDACIQETMRLKPVAPMLPLQALRDGVVAGVQVPAGTLVIGLLRHDSVSDEHLPRAAAFEPERWLAPDDGAAAAAVHAPRRLAMPFGAGPRICPGRYLALLEMKLAMAMLLSRFAIETVDAPGGGEAEERLAFTMTPVGLRLRLRPLTH